MEYNSSSISSIRSWGSISMKASCDGSILVRYFIQIFFSEGVDGLSIELKYRGNKTTKNIFFIGLPSLYGNFKICNQPNISVE